MPDVKGDFSRQKLGKTVTHSEHIELLFHIDMIWIDTYISSVRNENEELLFLRPFKRFWNVLRLYHRYSRLPARSPHL